MVGSDFLSEGTSWIYINSKNTPVYKSPLEPFTADNSVLGGLTLTLVQRIDRAV